MVLLRLEVTIEDHHHHEAEALLRLTTIVVAHRVIVDLLRDQHPAVGLAATLALPPEVGLVVDHPTLLTTLAPAILRTILDLVLAPRRPKSRILNKTKPTMLLRRISERSLFRNS